MLVVEKPPVVIQNTSYQSLVFSYQLPDVSHQLLVTSYQSLVTTHQLLVISYQLLVRSHQLLAISSQLLVANWQGYSKEFLMISSVFSFNPTQDGGPKSSPTSFTPVSFANEGISPQIFRTFSLILLLDWCKVSRPHLVSVPNCCT